MCFVFGSNDRGRHGAGAAATAKKYFGAIEGVGEGLRGNSYAIPTKDQSLNTKHLSDIQKSVDTFLETAAMFSDTQFMVTRFGCGLAGLSDGQIANLFADRELPKNVLLPGVWLKLLNVAFPNRIIIAGGRDFSDYPSLVKTCYTKLKTFKHYEIVSGGANGADKLGEWFAEQVGRDVTVFPAAWSELGKSAGPLRNAAMSWYSTHLIAFWDGKSTGTQNMIKTAERDGLLTAVIRYHIDY